jgi:TolB protein
LGAGEMMKMMFARYGSLAILAVTLASCGNGTPPATQTPPTSLAGFRRASAAFPDTRKNGPIIICANTGSGWQIYRIDPDGRHLKQITTMPATTYDAWFPLVSRDGARIAFTYGTANPSYGFQTNVYVVNIDGTGLKRLTHDGVSSFPAWSPDGRRLIYATQSVITQRKPYLVTVPLNDPDKRTPLTGDLLTSYYGEYTPDGKHIVYNTQDGGVVSAVWTMNLDGTQKRAISRAGPAFCPLTVSSDSRRVLVQNHCEYFAPLRRWIGIMNLEDASVTQLTEPPPGLFYDLAPSWSPDEKQIAFSSNRLTPGGLDLFVMKTDGTNIHRIATGLTVGGCPDDNCVTPSWATNY